MKQATLSRFWDRDKPEKKEAQVVHRIAIAEQTLAAIEKGSYTLSTGTYDLAEGVSDAKMGVKYYAPDSLLSMWHMSQVTPNSTEGALTSTRIDILEISTLEGARYLRAESPDGKIGILNFASAKKPGGGFLNGAQAQEESIARSSTLYPTLRTDTSRQFYTLHNKEKDNDHGFYTHAMVYSPKVTIFRTDSGDWTTPVHVDVLTCAAVNAGVARKSPLRHSYSPNLLEEAIEREMKERMARILFLLEKRGVQNLVLGSFGTGVFQNHVDVVARLWACLLTMPTARFKNSFSHIVFAILGNATFREFQDVFTETSQDLSSPVSHSESST
jgi:uncharacterized protein (TIGR02452 family)